MADKTGIEWCDATWNPLRGCSRVSEGCRNCYAEGVAARFCGVGQPYEGLAKLDAKGNRRWTGEVRLVEHMIDQPLRWKKPRRIFVNSMSDLFHEKVPDEWIDRIFAVMALAPQHTFQILTKRPDRMSTYLSAARAHPVGMEAFGITLDHHARNPKSTVGAGCMLQGDIAHLKIWPLTNVWLGVSVEDQKTADERIPLLLATPAAKRFISAEPLLGAVELRSVPLPHQWGRCDCLQSNAKYDALTSTVYCSGCCEGPEHMDAPHLDWVIVGGESGPNARPMHPDWARSLRDQCADAGVPFFFKQWGEWRAHRVIAGGSLGADIRSGRVRAVSPLESGETMRVPGVRYMARVGKRISGSFLDGRDHKEFPEPPND